MLNQYVPDTLQLVT